MMSVGKMNPKKKKLWNFQELVVLQLHASLQMPHTSTDLKGRKSEKKNLYLVSNTAAYKQDPEQDRDIANKDL